MEQLKLRSRPAMEAPSLVLAFTGWMDGGHVSTGTVEHFRRELAAIKIGEIDPNDFQVLHLPILSGPVTLVADGEVATVRAVSGMEQAGLLRPHCAIQNGLVRQLSFSKNELYAAPEDNLLLFSGEEPHLHWRQFADCLLEVVETFGVRTIVFVGSVAAAVPHTREPRAHASVSRPELRARMSSLNVSFSDYEGPAGFVTYLITRASERNADMYSLVVDIPHYPLLEIPTYTPSLVRGISVASQLLGIRVDTSGLQETAQAIRTRLKELMGENEEFRELVRKLEEAYDAEAKAADDEIMRRLIDGIDPV
ncbi:PAC2 family protein [bacterium]|nr:PAC2 family protein [bacterium]